MPTCIIYVANCGRIVCQSVVDFVLNTKHMFTWHDCFVLVMIYVEL